MKWRLWTCFAAVAMAGIVALIVSVRPDGDNGAESSRPVVRDPRGSSPVEAVNGKPKKSSRRSSSWAKIREKPILSADGGADADDERTPEEKALAERIEKALDDEKLDDALSCAGEALKCPVAEIRQNMVDTLGWFGKEALPELTPFLADADEDVRDSAKDEWMMALADIEDDNEKIGTVELAMRVLRDEDALEEISDEYIGVDEKLAVESLVRIIDGGGSKEGVEKAMETYEFVTGDEWAGAEEAARWIAEEYEPTE